MSFKTEHINNFAMLCTERKFSQSATFTVPMTCNSCCNVMSCIELRRFNLWQATICITPLKRTFVKFHPCSLLYRDTGECILMSFSRMSGTDNYALFAFDSMQPHIDVYPFKDPQPHNSSVENNAWWVTACERPIIQTRKQRSGGHWREKDLPKSLIENKARIKVI